MESNSFDVDSGVPAGSVLGPSLFIVFINDIPDHVTNAVVLLFADDLKLMLAINSPIHASIFQGAIDQLHEWCETNSLYLNLKKCYVMTFARIDNAVHYEYKFNNGQHTFHRVQQHRDLGIIFDSKLTFEIHRRTIIAKAKAVLWFVKRTLKNKFSINAAKILYCALVRSILEYCTVVWNPYCVSHSDSIESIQKQFLLWALREVYQRDENFVLPAYEMRCQFLDLHPLWRRRIQFAVFLIYDLLHLKLQSDSLRSRINYTRMQYDPNQRNLRNVELIRIDVNRTDYAHNQPFNVACRNFNLVRSQFFESSSRNVFRKNVNQMESNIFKAKL
jgi:hypothetical protein